VLHHSALNHNLTELQYGEVAGAISSAGLTKSDFDWQAVESYATEVGPGSPPFTVPCLVHRPTGYSFLFDLKDGRHFAVYRPGREGPTARDFSGSWELQFGYLRQWLDLVKANHEAPNFWRALDEQDRDLLALPASEQPDDTPFTPEERALVAEQLEGLREQIAAQFDVQGVRLDKLDETIEELNRATGRVGKRDWPHIVRSHLIGLVIDQVIPQGAFYAGLAYLSATIGHLLGVHGMRELPGPGFSGD